MLEILLNATKLALSEDARKGVSTIVELIQRSPEWQRDICELQAKIECDHQEHAALLSGLAATKLANLKYPDETISSFQTAYLELTANAFEHGCGHNGTITVTIEVSSVYVSAKVENDRGHEVELGKLLETCRQELARDPGRPRGRGLILVQELADTLQGMKPRTLKVVFYKDRVLFDSTRYLDVIVIRLYGGMQNPSLSRRIFKAVSDALRTHDVILDISGTSYSNEHAEIIEKLSVVSSFILADIIRMDAFARQQGHKFVTKKSPLQVGVPEFLEAAGVQCVTSWFEAARYLGLVYEEDEMDSFKPPRLFGDQRS